MINPEDLRQIGPYPVRRFIAQGGMAWVFEVIDPRFDAPRALKMLKPGFGADELFQRFRGEASKLAKLDHPNLITVFDFGLDDATGCHFYTMTLVDTPPLSKRGVLPIDEAIPIFTDVLSGLARLHEAGIVHRDIKPANILIHPDGRAMLADLGIARTADVSEGETWVTTSGSASGTKTGLAIGTPEYMSPEQARGRRGVGRPSDVFSFGLTMYKTLTGRTVYEQVEQIDSSSGFEIVGYLVHLSIARSEFEFAFDDETPRAIQEVIRRACHILPEARYQDASDMLAALRRAAEGESEEEETEEVVDWLRVGIAALLVLALGVGGWYAWRRIGAGVTRSPSVSLEDVSKLERQAAGVLDFARRADPPALPDVVSAAREEQQSAGTLLQLGRRKQEQSEPDAGVFLENARSGLQKSCAIVVAGDLQDRFRTGAEEVQRAAENLRSANIGELEPKLWADFEQGLASLAPPDANLPKCELAEQYQTGLEDVTKARGRARELEEAGKKRWPQLAEAAHEQALAARASAADATVAAPEYQAVLERAEGSVKAGDASLTQSAYLDARNSYVVAARDFEKAVVVSGAWRAQQSVRSLGFGADEDAEAAREIQRADGLYEAGQFQEAEELYNREAKFIDVLRARAAQSRGALAARQKADGARQKALADGAQRSAAAELEKADGLLGDAKAAFEREEFGPAESAYGNAAAAYDGASDVARREVDSARELGRKTHARAEGLGACEKLDAQVARPLCNRGLDALGLGDAALQAQDAPTARQEFGTAADSFIAARNAQDVYVKGLNVPPTIDSQKPAANQRVEIHPRESLHFAIGATDKNGDKLRYKWSVDGRDLAEDGNSLDLQPKADSEVQVAVDDGRGGVATTRWNVVVKNREPKLVLSPAADPITVAVDATQTFKAQASDPDGEDVTVALTLDGQPVPGSSYSFSAQTPGTHVLEASATDASGAVTTARRNITVVSRPNHAPLLSLSPAREPLRIAPGEKLVFDAKATDADDDPVNVGFSLDGRAVAVGTTYTFSSERPGSYTLQATATDSKGAANSLQRHILVESRTVAAAPPPPVAPPPPARPQPQLQPPPATVTPTPPAPSPQLDLDQVARTTLDRYQAAYEARSIDQLAAVWEMDERQKANMGAFFSSMKSVSIAISSPEVQKNGDQVEVRFDQVVTANGNSTPKASLLATLVRSGSGWKIQRLGPGKR